MVPEMMDATCSRELLYTAITRARERLTVAGTMRAVEEIVRRRTARESGLAARLREAEVRLLAGGALRF
jgi:exodeoxyribonuclease V alpha subunit